VYFTRVVSGVNKIYQTVLLDKDNPGPATPVAELNYAGASDWHACVRRLTPQAIAVSRIPNLESRVPSPESRTPIS
jgi:hypothetical protein